MVSLTDVVKALMNAIRMYQLDIKKYVQHQTKTTQVERVLLLLVVSGFVYISIWVC